MGREIVEKEAMYEELDERYQEKRIRMLQAQNMQIEEQLNRQLLAALAVRSGSQHGLGQNNQNNQHRGSSSSSASSASSMSGPSLASISARSSSVSSASPASVAHAAPHYGVHKKSQSQQLQQPRRASSITPRAAPINGVRKMSLDLSSLRSPGSQGMQTGPLTSPMIMDHGYVVSPVYDTFPNNQSGWYSPQTPSYIQQPQWAPQWTTGFEPPQQQQQHVIQNTGASQIQGQSPTRQFRDRFASAPEIPIHSLPTTSAMSTTPVPQQQPPQQQQQEQQSQHSQMQSESSVPMMVMQRPLPTPISKPVSPKTQPMVNDAYPSPTTPQASPKSAVPAPAIEAADPLSSLPETSTEDTGLLFSSNGSLDPDYDDFSQFALGLGGNTTDWTERDPFTFEDFVAFDDFTAAA